MGKKKNFENKETFAERHPRINAIIGLCILLAGIFLAFVLIRIIILQIGQGIEQIINFLKNCFLRRPANILHKYFMLNLLLSVDVLFLY